MRRYGPTFVGIAIGLFAGLVVGITIRDLAGTFNYLPFLLAAIGSYIGMILGERWSKGSRAASRRRGRQKR
jgi:hypothetical protein